MALSRGVYTGLYSRINLVEVSLGVLLLCTFPALAQTQQSGAMIGTKADQQRDPQAPGTISGEVVDPSGSLIANAEIELLAGDQSSRQHVVSNEHGQYLFADTVPGTFQLTVSSKDFASQSYFGTLHPAESYVVPAIRLVLATASTEVQVSLSRSELAEAQIKDQEKQRVLGILPNFYVTYDPTAVPLRPKQKLELAWKSTIDPINFGLTAAVAGIHQATNASESYGQGAQGYAKRYGAGYVDLATANFIGSAVVPIVLKQDPRYFYRGKGTVRSRIVYAIAASLICKGDNGHWQPNYSGIAGGLASGEISTLYHPGGGPKGVESTLESALVIVGSTAADNLLQEFLIRKLIRHIPNYAPANP